MKLFKNDVGRPSNETLRKRKIAYLSIAVAVIVSLIGVLGFGYSYFSGKGIIGNSKNAKSSDRVVNKSTVRLSISRKLFLDLITDSGEAELAFWSYTQPKPRTRTVYSKYVVYQNNKVFKQSECSIKFSLDSFYTKFKPKENNSYYVRYYAYSDSKCTKQLAYVKTDTYKVGTIKPEVNIKEYSWKTNENYLTYEVVPKLPRNTYARVSFYNDRRAEKTSACTKVKYNTEVEMNNPLAKGGKQFYKVTLYSDSKCTKKLNSAVSETFATSPILPTLKFNDKKIEKNVHVNGGTSTAYVTSSVKTVPVWDLSKTQRTLYYSAVRVVYNITTGKQTKAKIITCKKVSSGTNSQLMLSVDKQNIRAAIETEFYSDSRCENKLVGSPSIMLLYDTEKPTFETACLDTSTSKLIIKNLKDRAYTSSNGISYYPGWPKEAAVANTLCSLASSKQAVHPVASQGIKLTSAQLAKKQLKLCIWDYAGNVTEKVIALKKCK